MANDTKKRNAAQQIQKKIKGKRNLTKVMVFIFWMQLPLNNLPSINTIFLKIIQNHY